MRQNEGSFVHMMANGGVTWERFRPLFVRTPVQVPAVISWTKVNLIKQ